MAKLKTKPEPKKETTGELIRSFIYAIAIALVFRSVAFEPFHIPSESMLSTLYKGDYIFVSKYSYGYSRFSFPLSLPLFEGRIMADMPQRGDVVVFRKPTRTSIDFIKRVIGLPGDTIQMKHDRLYINGELVEQTRRGEVSLPMENGGEQLIAKYEETLPGGRTHIVLDETTNGAMDDTAIYIVPDGHYFMMGDNRDNSQDSRYLKEVGFVPFENIIGRAEIILLSFDTNQSFWKFWDWPANFREGRWFKRIV